MAGEGETKREERGRVSEMELSEIMKILPHRYPMLFVDRILETDFKKRIVGLKNLTANEPFFQGHFPGNPVMPAVLQLELMAQVGGVLVNRLMKTDGKIAYFLAADKARFRRMVGPGDQLRVEIDLVRMRLGMARVRGCIVCEGDRVSEADLMFGWPRGEIAE